MRRELRDDRITLPSKNVGGRYRVGRAGVTTAGTLELVAIAIVRGREPATGTSLTRVRRANDLKLNTVELGLVLKAFKKESPEPAGQPTIRHATKPEG